MPCLEQPVGSVSIRHKLEGFAAAEGLAALITLPQQKLDALLARHSLVESELASGLSPEAYVKLSREFAELSPVVEAIKAYRSAEKEIAELSALVDDSATDAEMRKLADVERHALQERKEKLGTADPAGSAAEGRDG